MFSDKLFSLLQSLPKVQRNRFRKYLLSPYLNDQPDLLLLFDVADAALREGDFAELDKVQVWQKIFPEKQFNDAQLRRLASDLNQMALQFLAAEARPLNPLADALEMQRLLEKPELKKHLEGVERNIERLMQHAEGASTEYYLAQFNLHYNVSNRTAKHMSATGYADKMAKADFYLECFYLTQKLKIHVGWLLFQKARTTAEVVGLPKGFWDEVAQERYQHVPLLCVYRKVVDCLSAPDQEQYFRELLENLDEYAGQLAKDDLRQCYFIAQNYCALKINQGKHEYYREMFEIFKKTIHLGILLEQDTLSEGIFKNIVTAGLGVGEFDWTERFIEEYAVFLPPTIRENARTFNLSYLYFHKKNYQKVIDLLQHVAYSGIAYALGAKLILIQTYYEVGELMAMESLIDSLRIFLRRDKTMSKNLQMEYLSYLSFVKSLLGVQRFDKNAIARLREKILASTVPIYKKWLLEKIDGLQNK